MVKVQLHSIYSSFLNILDVVSITVVVLRNDLYCVGWGVKLLLTHSLVCASVVVSIAVVAVQTVQTIVFSVIQNVKRTVSGKRIITERFSLLF